MSMYEDLEKIIGRHQPISTAECCEHLEKLGYGGSLSWDDYRAKISKALYYMGTKGKIVGHEVPRTNNKPLRMWCLSSTSSIEEINHVSPATRQAVSADAQQDKKASADAVIQSTSKKTISSDHDESRSLPITLQDAMSLRVEFSIESHELDAFMLGIQAAEQHHLIV